MNGKGLWILLGIGALIAVVVLMWSSGEDESTADRKENFNTVMEETMRSTGRRAEIEEELAEEAAMLEQQKQQQQGGTQ